MTKFDKKFIKIEESCSPIEPKANIYKRVYKRKRSDHHRNGL